MKKEGKILVVDDDKDILLTLRFFLRQHFELVQTEHNPNLIPRHIRNQKFDVILLDMNYRKGDTSGKEGLLWLQKVLALLPDANVIMITAYGDVKMAVEAIKYGAIDFVVKPWRNEKLLATIMSAYKLSQSKQTVEKLKSRQKLLSEELEVEIIGQSPNMKKVFNTIEKVAATDANVLILGENGTGKEMIARSLHKQSERADEVFINVDLGSISETLFESELFGHKKGSFTGAYEDRMGRFEAASGGTLFLDEIGNLSLPLQAKLLTVLQRRQIMRVGDNSPIDIDIRLICATNMPLYEMLSENKFRQDLLYRINTVEILLPALRERVQDIPLLAAHFLNSFKRKYKKPELTIAEATIKKLQQYNWPGNIRELRHALERSVILCEGNILKPEDFLFHKESASKENEASFETYNLAEMERWAIRKAMTKNNGNISKAALELGLTRAALYRRLEKYGL